MSGDYARHRWRVAWSLERAFARREGLRASPARAALSVGWPPSASPRSQVLQHLFMAGFYRRICPERNVRIALHEVRMARRLRQLWPCWWLP